MAAPASGPPAQQQSLHGVVPEAGLGVKSESSWAIRTTSLEPMPQEASVDHIIPRTVVPELDNVIANLELLPLRLNERKNAKVGVRQLDLGRKLYKAGLLSGDGLRALERARGGG